MKASSPGRAEKEVSVFSCMGFTDKCIVVKPSLCENGPNFPRHFGLKLGMVFGRISGDVPYGSFDFSLKILV